MTQLSTRRLLTVCFAAFGTLVLAGCVSTTGAVSEAPDPHDVQATAPGHATCTPTSAAETAAALAATNAARAARGMTPLTADPRLTAAAEAHACDMAKRGLMSHRGTSTKGPMKRLQGKGYNPRIVSENIAAGPFGIQRVASEWNHSARHLDNILIPDTRHFGIGHAIGVGGKTVFWAGVYAVPMPK